MSNATQMAGESLAAVLKHPCRLPAHTGAQAHNPPPPAAWLRYPLALLCLVAISAPQAATVLEEVVVTAEKRAENVQDVGLSISAFGADAMERGGLDDVSRIELLVPGVNFAYAGNDAKFNVRGANSTNTFNDNGSIVGTYVDGVYKPRASQQSRAFFDVERIEFLKGPQGTLYGRNTFAGALNLYTNRPNLDGVSGDIKVGYERFNTMKFEGAVNLPVSDEFAVRLAGFVEDGDGFVKNSAGPDVGAPNDHGMRFSALWTPTDEMDVLFRYTRIRESGTSAGLFGYRNICRRTTSQGLTDPLGSVVDCQNPQNGSNKLPRGNSGAYEIAQDYVPPMDLDDDNITLEINYDAGPVLVKSITSYTNFENLIGFDFDYSQTPFNIGGFDETAKSFTQELQFTSNYDSPFQWTSGAYYSQDKTFFSFSIFNQTRENNNRPTVVAPGGGNLTLLDGTPIVSAATDLNGPFADSQWINIDTFGLYLQGEFSVQENLRLIAGARYNYEKKDLTGGGSNFTRNGPPVTWLNKDGDSPLVVPEFSRDVFSYDRDASGANTLNKSFNNVSWKAGLEYDLTEQDAMLYFTVSTGFLSGAVNSNGTSTEEQESQLYEAGIKSTLLDDTLRLNLSAHYTEYTNMLAQFQVPDPNTGNVITNSRNGGEITAWGIEVDSIYQATENLTLTAAVGYLNAEFGTFGQTNPYQLFDGEILPDNFVDMKGRTPGWSPEFTATLSAAYEVALDGGGSVTPYIQFYYSDGYNTSNLLALDPSHQQGSFTKTDLRVIWRSASQKYSLEGFVENLEDKAVLARGNNGGDDNVQTGYLYPRNFGVRFAASWD